MWISTNEVQNFINISPTVKIIEISLQKSEKVIYYAFWLRAAILIFNFKFCSEFDEFVMRAPEIVRYVTLINYLCTRDIWLLCAWLFLYVSWIKSKVNTIFKISSDATNLQFQNLTFVTIRLCCLLAILLRSVPFPLTTHSNSHSILKFQILNFYFLQ